MKILGTVLTILLLTGCGRPSSHVTPVGAITHTLHTCTLQDAESMHATGLFPPSQTNFTYRIDSASDGTSMAICSVSEVDQDTNPSGPNYTPEAGSVGPYAIRFDAFAGDNETDGSCTITVPAANYNGYGTLAPVSFTLTFTTTATGAQATLNAAGKPYDGTVYAFSCQ